MVQTFMHYAEYLALFVIGVIVAGIAFNVLCWLVVSLYQQGVIFIDWASQQLMRGTARSGTFLKSLLCESVRLVFGVIWGTWLRLYQPCYLAARKLSIAVRQYVKLRQLFWQYGCHEFATFAQFRRSVLGEEEPPKKERARPAAPEKSSYAQALEVMGFSESQAFDKTMLKARHRELAAILHPDKEFPNTVFMQQVNDAVDCIKRAKKWK